MSDATKARKVWCKCRGGLIAKIIDGDVVRCNSCGHPIPRSRVLDIVCKVWPAKATGMVLAQAIDAPCRAVTNVCAHEAGDCLRCGAANGQSCLKREEVS